MKKPHSHFICEESPHLLSSNNYFFLEVHWGAFKVSSGYGGVSLKKEKKFRMKKEVSLLHLIHNLCQLIRDQSHQEPLPAPQQVENPLYL